MNRRERSAVIIVGSVIFVIFLVVTTFYVTVDPDKYRPRIVKTLEALTGYPVSLGKVEFSPTSGFVTLKLNNLEIKSLAPDEPPILLVKQAFLGVGLSFLFYDDDNPATKIHLSSLTLVAPQINYIQRHHTSLVERAQKTADVSNRKMEKVLGHGLNKLSIGKVTIRDGIMTILNWHDPKGRTWIIDHLQVAIHGLSPRHSSPLTASARFQLVPFSSHGHVGPLPESLDLFDLPLLLNIEAKSVELSHLANTLPGLPHEIEPHVQRGFFTTLIHGSLNEGLNSRTTLELDKLTFAADDLSDVPKTTQMLLVNVLNMPPMDIALRQKSTARIIDGVPHIDFEEFYLDLNGHPQFDITGSLILDESGSLDLSVAMLESLTLEEARFLADLTPLESGSIIGSFKIHGNWPEEVEVSAKMNLTDAGFTLPPHIRKEAGTPLEAEISLHLQQHHIAIRDMALSRIGDTRLETALSAGTDKNQIQISGDLFPDVHLHVVGLWDMEQAADFLPFTKAWNAEGLTNLDLIIHTSADDPTSHIQGSLSAERLRFGQAELLQVNSELLLTNDRLFLPWFTTQYSGGVVSGSILAAREKTPRYYASYTMTGVTLSSPDQHANAAKDDTLLERMTEGVQETAALLENRRRNYL
ncbi:MAG: hypothetical protein HQL50_13305, partial [Magnetococcales bacterium]|nr:hypothetical protein [Magnetococcales bacterium]